MMKAAKHSGLKELMMRHESLNNKERKLALRLVLNAGPGDSVCSACVAAKPDVIKKVIGDIEQCSVPCNHAFS